MFPETLHHAYLIEANKDVIESELKSEVADRLSITFEANPDFVELDLDLFSIEDARSLSDYQSKKALGVGNKVIIISFNKIVHETQNALLKVLEEPTEGTHIFLVTPSLIGFLPTLLSRVEVIRVSSSGETVIKADEFMNASIVDRQKMIKKIIDSKDRVEADRFLSSLEKHCYEEGVMESKDSLHEILFAKKYLHDRGSSTKQLLEHVALVL